MAFNPAIENGQLLLEKVSSPAFVQRLPWMIMGFGVLVRLYNYLDNRSLWVDEAALSRSIASRSYTELFDPLDTLTGAPTGFLAVERLFIALLGNNEFALRLFPLLAGLASLFLFYVVARKYLQPLAVHIALTFFAISPLLIRYSGEVKQYSIDVLVSLILLYLTTLLVSRGLPILWLGVYALVGAAMIWFSHPSVFVLAGFGLSLGLLAVKERAWLKAIVLSLVSVVWVASFGISYIATSVDRLVSEDTGIVGNFEQTSRFMPLPPTSFSDIAWYVTTFFEVFDNPVGISLTGMAALAFILGIVALFRNDKFNLLILVSPIVVVLLVSGLRFYPFGDRWILFLTPFMIMLTGAGVGYIVDKTRDSFPLLGYGFMGILLFHTLLTTGFNIISPPAREEIKPLMSYMAANRTDGDVIYVYYGSEQAFKYYAERYGFDEGEFITGVNSRGIQAGYLDDINGLQGNERVWLIMSHILRSDNNNEEDLFLRHFDEMGERLDTRRAAGAALYLYDLSDNAPN